MFTQDNLHHAAIEDIVRDLLSRIEALECAHPDIIIKPNEAAAEMEKLKAENVEMKHNIFALKYWLLVLQIWFQRKVFAKIHIILP